MNRIRSLVPLTLIAIAGAPASADVNERFFDSPWIGYDTSKYPQGYLSWSSRAADLNADGAPDLAVVSWYSNSRLTILFGDGKGAYLPPVFYTIPLGSLDLEIADFDNDGDPDIVVCDTGQVWEGSTVSYFLNDGEGEFVLAGQFNAGNGPSGITKADFNDDGWLDIAVAHDAYIVSANTIAVMLGSFSGFGPPQIITLQGGTRAITSGDLDGDGDPDLVVGHESNRWTYVRNNGGSFSAMVVVPGINAGSIPELPCVHVRDVDLDQDLDVFFSNRDTGGVGQGGIGLWRNNGDGTFGAGELLSFNVWSNGGVNIDSADFTSDGWPDVTAATEATGNWFLMINDGAGGFEPAIRYRAGDSPIAIDTPDLDLDGLADVVVVARDSLEACVYLNPGDGAFVQPPVIDMTTPAIAPAFTPNLQGADIDGDSDLDLVTGYRSDFEESFGLSVRKNTGDGSFGPIETYLEVTYPLQVRLGDVTGDDHPDLVWIDAGDRLRIRYNDGAGSFAVRDSSHVVSAGEEGNFELNDVDSDGDLDVVVAARFDVGVLLNSGSGTFAAPIYTDMGNFFEALALGDFDEDGNPDLLTDTGVQGYPEISLGNGDGTFQSPNTVPTGRSVTAFDIADIDGDGNLDFAAYYNLDETGMSVRRGRGDGNFFPNASYPGSYDSADHTSSIKLADVDGDDALDALTVHYGAQDMSFWKGNGDGTFQDKVRYGIGQPSVDVAVGEFTGDGLTDVAVLTQQVLDSWWYPGVVLIRGIDPDGGGETEADLVGYSIVTGTNLAGNINDLRESDNSHLRNRSGFGRTFSDLHHLEFLVDANTTRVDPAFLDLTIEGRITHASGNAHIRLWNFDLSRFDQVTSYAIGANEQAQAISDIPAGPYVDDNGDIQVSIKQIVVVPIFAFTFESFTDMVKVDVR